jgi:hypothetical protein
MRRWLPVLVALALGGCGQATSKHARYSLRHSIPAGESEKAGKKPNLSAKRCFADPEGCGYPGPNNVGPGGEGTAKCASYKTESPAGGKFEANIAGHEYKELNIKGYVYATAANITFNDVCVTQDGGEEGAAFTLTKSSPNMTIENSVVRGGNATNESVQEAVRNIESYVTGLVMTRDRVENCADCLQTNGTVNESYVSSNGGINKHGTDHYEDWFVPEGRTIRGNDDTLVNPENQTAEVFVVGTSGCRDSTTITNSLLAGGGFIIYACGNLTFTGNRIARCLKSPVEGESGGHYCDPGSNGERFAGTDTHGLFPNGGYFGLLGSPLVIIPSLSWSGNFWDNNLEKVEP